LAVGDFNRDGHPDVVTANYGSNDITVLLGDGAGGFRTPNKTSLGDGVKNAVYVAIDDLDGDGNLDVVTVNRGADNPPGLDNIAVLWGQGNGFFGTPELFSLGSDVSGPASIAFGDFDEDGKPDLLTANSGSSNITLLLENGLRSFATPKIFDVGIGAASPVAVAVA